MYQFIEFLADKMWLLNSLLVLSFILVLVSKFVKDFAFSNQHQKDSHF